MLGCGLVVSERDGRFVFYRHADQHVSMLLSVADQIVAETARDILECPQCGTRI